MPISIPVRAHVPPPAPGVVPNPPTPHPIDDPDVKPPPEIDDPPLPGEDVPVVEPPAPKPPGRRHH